MYNSKCSEVYYVHMERSTTRNGAGARVHIRERRLSPETTPKSALLYPYPDTPIQSQCSSIIIQLHRISKDETQHCWKDHAPSPRPPCTKKDRTEDEEKHFCHTVNKTSGVGSEKSQNVKRATETKALFCISAPSKSCIPPHSVVSESPLPCCGH